MITKNSLRDQLVNRNMYDILLCWNKRLRDNSNTCIKEVIMDAYYYSDNCFHNCNRCIERLMNDIVPSQTGQRP